MIYFVYSSLVPNSAPTIRALAYLDAFERNRVHVTVLCFFPDDHKTKVIKDSKYIKVKYYWDKCYFNNGVLKYFSYFNYLIDFRKRLRKGDHVYIYSLNDVIRAVVNKKGVKVYYEMTECPELGINQTRFFPPSLETHFDFCKKVEKLIVISNSLKSYYVAHGVEGNRIEVINMTVTPERFEYLRKDNNAEQYIAYCGTVGNYKDGVNILLDAFALVVKKHPEIKLYVIGGALSREELESYHLFLSQKGIKDKVVLTGVVDSTRMPQLLKNATILTLARPDNKQSKYGFPTKLGEYLMTGNPVVLTSVGDIPFFLKDKESAMIARPDDSIEFAEKIIWCLEHPEESALVGESGKKVALQFFNSHIESQKLIKLLTE